MKERITWAIEDHICKNCGGRILRGVTGAGMTPGGNPLYRCADCGAHGYALDEICWCGLHHRNQTMEPYQCLPFSAIKDDPGLLQEFAKCGCDPGRGEVGIVLKKRKFKTLENEE